MPGRPPPGPHPVFGDDFGAMLHNQVRNPRERRISIVQTALERS